MSRYLETLLYVVNARDWMVFATVTVLLLAVAIPPATYQREGDED